MRPRRRRATLAVVSVLLLTIAPAALAHASAADTITVRQQQIDVNPGETNPCTGVTGTIIDGEQDVFHITALADGTLHLSGRSTVAVTFTPDDPQQVAYEGHETFALSESSGGQTFVITSTNHVRVKGTDGSFVTVREVAHLTITTTGVISEFDKPTLICS